MTPDHQPGPPADPRRGDLVSPTAPDALRLSGTAASIARRGDLASPTAPDRLRLSGTTASIAPERGWPASGAGGARPPRRGSMAAGGWWALLLALAVLPLTLGCLGQTKPIVKLGLVAPLAGEGSEEGYRWVFAAKQAIAEWNRTPGRPVQVELVSQDESDGSVAARRLAADPDVVAVVGHWRPDVADDAHLAYATERLTLLSLAHGGCEARDGPVLCVAPAREALTGAVTQFARGRAPQASIAVVAGPDLTDLTLAEGLQAGLLRAGLRLVRNEAALPYASDFREMRQRLAAANPDLLVFAGSLQASLAFARDVPLADAVRVLVPHRYAPSLEAAAPGFRLAPYGEPGGPAFTAFSTAFRERWGEPVSTEAVVVYDATRLLLRALERAPARADRRAELTANLRAGGAFIGVAGVYTPGPRRVQLSAAPVVVPLGR